MASPTFSRDLWDYLDDLKDYMPSRRDRDVLVRAAEADPAEAKRVRIWDYFFRVHPEDLGRPQKKYIEVLTERQKNDLRAARARARQRLKWFLPVPILGILLSIASMIVPMLLIPGAAIALLGIGALIWVWRARSSTLQRIERAYQHEVAQLKSAIEKLKAKIPEPPSHDQMYAWFKEDVAWLSGRALDATHLAKRKVDIDGSSPNPLCILGPAQLQNPKAIPAPFADPRAPDLRKHLTASNFALLSDETFADFYGVYYIEFIIVATDMLGNYGCYFDFITRQVYGEHTAEMYYQDVVYLSTKDEYREINVNWFEPRRLVKAPTFAMSLASGDSVQVSFASMDYINGLKAQIPKATIQLEPSRWVNNPGLVADQAIGALRKYLREHKGK
jgi:hypothetical protein